MRQIESHILFIPDAIFGRVEALRIRCAKGGRRRYARDVTENDGARA